MNPVFHLKNQCICVFQILMLKGAVIFKNQDYRKKLADRIFNWVLEIKNRIRKRGLVERT
ncbi:MAG: hypothetical protein A2V86_18255 [Deltaproteobacteria bacterium RBG_16_49_23]|nr:MAG: hypothetical protein A2V86_18255 [Deltaproteobacteria bacterium RBG_16_49_23]